MSRRIVASLASRAPRAIPLNPTNGLPLQFNTWAALVRPASRQSFASSHCFSSDSKVDGASAQVDESKSDVDAEGEAAEVEIDPVVELTTRLAAVEAEKVNLKDQLLRALAEQENIRGIAKRDMESARNFGATKMAKSLLDVSDNLSRALEVVPEDERADTEKHPSLASLYEGVDMTNMLFSKALASNNILKFGEVGDLFDPSLHNAMFEYDDPTMEGGTVGQVMKVGFTLNGRVIRAADVGTVKKK